MVLPLPHQNFSRPCAARRNKFVIHPHWTFFEDKCEKNRGGQQRQHREGCAVYQPSANPERPTRIIISELGEHADLVHLLRQMIRERTEISGHHQQQPG